MSLHFGMSVWEIIFLIGFLWVVFLFLMPIMYPQYLQYKNQYEDGEISLLTMIGKLLAILLMIFVVLYFGNGFWFW